MATAQLSVAVLGAAGTIAPAIVHDLAASDEVARMVLPLNIYSSMYVTMNARSLMNFLSLRRHVDGSAFPSFPQREIEMVAEQMESLWAGLMPLTHAAFVRNGRVCP